MKLTVNASRRTLAATCMATNDIRFYLNGVRIEPRPEGGVYLVGTDGHRLMAVIDETGHVEKPCIIRLDSNTFAKLPKINTKEGWTATTIEIEGATYLAVKDDKSKIAHLQAAGTDGLFIDSGKYVDWRSVMKFKERTELQNIGAFALPYLASIQKAIHCNKLGLPVRLYSAHEGDGILVHIIKHEYAAMIIMPMREDFGDKSVWTGNFTKPSALPEPKRNDAIDKALATAFTELDRLANLGVIARME